MNHTLIHALIIALVYPVSSFAQGDENGKPDGVTARGLVVERIENPAPQFSVRVDVDNKDRTYHEDDLVTATVRSSQAGYLYLLYCDAAGDAFVVYPNKYQKTNRITAQQTIRIPSPTSNFQFRVSPPFGTEVLKAIVTDKPLSAKALPDLTNSEATQLSTGQVQALLKGIVVEQKSDAQGGGTPSSKIEHWAEHSVQITTLARDVNQQPRTPRRIYIGIGISDYRSPRIRDLSVCHRDAVFMRELMLRKCGVQKSDCLLLLNEDATQANVTRLFCDVLPKQSAAGDTIFIFWSGHGGRCADTGGEEEDGLDEYLPFYDSVLGKQETVLLDDTFGRWMQKLDGRKLVIILDACHAGGQGDTAKATDQTDWQTFDFASNELARAKDIGQDNSAIVASSVSAEASRERIEGDLSVLTYYIIKILEQANGPITLDELVQSVAPEVKTYIQTHFEGSKQTVFFQNDLAEPLQLNP